MAIGAINAYGAMSAVQFRPYVYNANTVSAASMNRLSRISDDVLDKKIDYTELTDERLNENPLKKGQTLNFQDMLDMQMRRGQNIASRIIRPMEEEAGALQGAEEETAKQPVPVKTETVAARFDPSDREAVQVPDETAAYADSGNINYQMQQALQAYEMFMTA